MVFLNVHILMFNWKPDATFVICLQCVCVSAHINSSSPCGPFLLINEQMNGIHSSWKTKRMFN